MLFGRALRAAISRRGNASPAALNADNTRDEWTTDLTRYRSRGVSLSIKAACARPRPTRSGKWIICECFLGGNGQPQQVLRLALQNVVDLRTSVRREAGSRISCAAMSESPTERIVCALDRITIELPGRSSSGLRLTAPLTYGRGAARPPTRSTIDQHAF